MITISFLACNSQKRQVRRLDELAILQKSEFLRLSNTLNPCFNGKAKADTSIIYGTPDTNFSFSWHLDSGYNLKLAPFPGVLPSSLPKIITKTVTIRVPIREIITDTVPDMRKIAALNDIITDQQNQIQDAQKATIKAQQQYQDANASATYYKRAFWALVAVLGLYIGLRIYLKFSGTGTVASIIKKI